MSGRDAGGLGKARTAGALPAEQGTATVILLIPNVDDDDLAAIVENLEFPNQVLVISNSPFVARHKETGFPFIRDSCSDARALIAKIVAWKEKNRRSFAGIIGLDEEYHYALSRAIADAFSLPYHSKETLDRASNKYLQRLALEKAGVRIPWFQLIDQETDVHGLAYPNVLKLITGYASLYVFMNRDASELERHRTYIQKTIAKRKYIALAHQAEHEGTATSYDPAEQYIVEEYLPGTEYSCDFMVEKDGAVHVLRVVKKFPRQELGFFEAKLLFNPDAVQGEFKLRELEGVCTKIARTMNVAFGVCMLDFMLCKGEIVVVETTVRPGVSSFIALMGALYHDTSINKAVRQRLGMPVDTTIPNEAGLAVYLYAPHTGRIAAFDTRKLEEHQKKLGIISISKYYMVGERIRKYGRYDHFMLMAGLVLMRGVEPSQAGQLIETVKRHTRIVMEDASAPARCH